MDREYNPAFGVLPPRSGDSSGSQSQINSARAIPTAKPATEMEALGGNLADTARRLQAVVDKLQDRLDRFSNAATALKGDTARPDTPPSPQPGTIGCIKHFHENINVQVERLNIAVNNLQGIL